MTTMIHWLSRTIMMTMIDCPSSLLVHGWQSLSISNNYWSLHNCQLSIEYIFILYIENDPSQPKLTSKALKCNVHIQVQALLLDSTLLVSDIETKITLAETDKVIACYYIQNSSFFENNWYVITLGSLWDWLIRYWLNSTVHAICLCVKWMLTL